MKLLGVSELQDMALASRELAGLDEDVLPLALALSSAVLLDKYGTCLYLAN